MIGKHEIISLVQSNQNDLLPEVVTMLSLDIVDTPIFYIEDSGLVFSEKEQHTPLDAMTDTEYFPVYDKAIYSSQYDYSDGKAMYASYVIWDKIQQVAYTFVFMKAKGAIALCPEASIYKKDLGETTFTIVKDKDYYENSPNPRMREMQSYQAKMGSVIGRKISKLLTCKNIIEETVPAPVALNKSRIKKGKIPIYDHRILKVQLSSKKKNSSNEYELSGTTALHMCMGHFKEYTEDRPLFGRLVGRFWWQPHMRGDMVNGKVTKDYKI